MFTAFQCPVSRQPLQFASSELVTIVNRWIKEQRLVTVEGQGIPQGIEGGWYCSQSQRFYPIRDGILCLIADQAFDVRQLLTQEERR
ncbi:MAG: hypothetical protein JNL67_14790 [Planctomycetaceae bacterium]|nr:hypothetical protein [Planctomycetaceae bacterium]